MVIYMSQLALRLLKREEIVGHKNMSIILTCTSLHDVFTSIVYKGLSNRYTLGPLDCHHHSIY